MFTVFFSVTVGADSSFEQVDRLVSQWTDIEQQRSLIESQWRKRQAVLDQQIILFEAELNALQKALSEDSRQTSEVEQQRKQLVEEQIQAERDQAVLEAALVVDFAELKSLHGQLPPPLQQLWADRLSDVALVEADTSERLDLLLSLLTELENFDKRVALHEDIMLIDGQEVQVQQVYLGLSQAWYTDIGGRHAGYGFSSPLGWQWLAHGEVEGLAPKDVLELVRMLQNPGTARLLDLPLRLHGFNAAAHQGGL